MENLIWKNTANRIIIAILIYSIAGFIGPIMAGIGSCISSVDGIYDYTVYEQAFSENYGATINYWEFLGYTFELFAIAGYAIFFTAIGKFSKIQKDEEDSRAVRMIRTSYILLAAGTLVGYLFLVGTIIKAILFITSYILLIIGYSRLKNSQRIPEKGRKGAGKLFLCAILGLVASILGAIPLAGDFIEGVMQLAIFIIALIGWSQIKNGAPEADKNDMFQQAVHTRTKETKSLTTLVLTDTIMGVVLTILFMLHSVLPSIEMSDFPVPFATGLGVYTNIAFLIYLIVFTTKRRGALQLTGALVMVTITTIGVINRIFPLHFIFVGDYYEGVGLFYDVCNSKPVTFLDSIYSTDNRHESQQHVPHCNHFSLWNILYIFYSSNDNEQQQRLYSLRRACCLLQHMEHYGHCAEPYINHLQYYREPHLYKKSNG